MNVFVVSVANESEKRVIISESEMILRNLFV